jgi:drug/metabolite transporter (DMT)-like permease
MPVSSGRLKGFLWLVVCVLSWGALFPVAKRTLAVLDPFALASLRYAFGILLFIGVLWAVEGRRALAYGDRLWPAIRFGIIGIGGFNILVWWGLAFTRPEHASVIAALQAPMTAIAMWLLRGVRPARFTLACVVVAVAGVFLVVTKGDLAGALGGGSLLGDLLVFLGAVSWVVYTMAAPRFPGWSPLRFTVLTCIPGTACLFAMNALTIATGYTELPTLDQIWSLKWQIVYFSVFTVVLGILGFNNGVKFLGPLNAMLMLNFIPIFVFAIEAWLGRSFGILELGGAAVVVGALVANNLYLRRMPAPPRP